jgi:hypothetical protein
MGKDPFGAEDNIGPYMVRGKRSGGESSIVRKNSAVKMQNLAILTRGIVISRCFN